MPISWGLASRQEEEARTRYKFQRLHISWKLVSRYRKKVQDKTQLSMAYFLQLGPPPNISSLPKQNQPPTEVKISTHELWGDTSY